MQWTFFTHTHTHTHIYVYIYLARMHLLKFIKTDIKDKKYLKYMLFFVFYFLFIKLAVFNTDNNKSNGCWKFSFAIPGINYFFKQCEWFSESSMQANGWNHLLWSVWKWILKHCFDKFCVFDVATQFHPRSNYCHEGRRDGKDALQNFIYFPRLTLIQGFTDWSWIKRNDPHLE